MTITNNDPKLTAFVLGELNEDEAKEIQAVLDSDAELKAEVDAIRQTVAEIETVMKNEPLPNSAKANIAPKRKNWFVRVAAAVSTIAAILIFALVYLPHNEYLYSDRDAAVSFRAVIVPQPAPTEFAAEQRQQNPQLGWMGSSSSASPASVPPSSDSSLDVSSIDRAWSGFAPTDFDMSGTVSNTDTITNVEHLNSPAAKSSPTSTLSSRTRKSSGSGLAMMVEPRVIIQEDEETIIPPMIAPPPAIDPLNDSFNHANDEAYKIFVENDFKPVKVGEFSTFSIDVDSAAYTTMRRYINETGTRPPIESIRLEEYINYFKYDYAPPTDGKPFATHTDVSQCPWEPKHLLARIGIKGKEYSVDERPPLNLVFLIDTSGSMLSSNRLPLVKRGLTELVELLQPKDRVAIVTYAGESRLALPSISGQEKQAILDSINALGAGGSTAGAAGIKTAYETARKYYNKQAQNRVILCTDGDFNVGETNNKTLEEMIGEEAKSGVFLTILGFGMGNYKDERLKTLSMRGNGNYGYIDNIEEARRLLVEGLTGTLFAIAKDVKIQVDFNPAKVAGYRLLGYENRKLRDEDFHNDKIDAGEIGAGHTVTALYEIVPVGEKLPTTVDSSRYADQDAPTDVKTNEQKESKETKTNELLFVKLRYKLPDADKSSLLEYPVDAAQSQMSADSQFASAVALYGMLLRKSQHSGNGTFDSVLELATPNTKNDKYRKEFIELVKKAKELQ